MRTVNERSCTPALYGDGWKNANQHAQANTSEQTGPAACQTSHLHQHMDHWVLVKGRGYSASKQNRDTQRERENRQRQRYDARCCRWMLRHCWEKSAEHGWICRSEAGQDECSLPKKSLSAVIAEQKKGLKEVKSIEVQDYWIINEQNSIQVKEQEEAHSTNVKCSVNHRGSYIPQLF